MSKKHAPKKPASYHRETGVIRRSGQLGSRPGSAITGSPNVIDGGDDAPLTARSRAVFRSSLLALFVVFVALMLLSLRGY